MTTLYKFKAYYTDAGVGAVQDPAPTCTVINMADDSKLADAQATTASTNMPGLYSYEYSGADGLDCVAFFATTDTGCDVKQLASYVSEKITTNLNADVAGVETKLDTVDANVDSILADTGTDGVVLKAAGLAADAVTEIQSGLATAAALDAVDNFVDTEVAAILAAVDTEVAAIKAKTDNLPASPAAVGSAMTLTPAYDKAKDDVLTPLGVVDGIVDAIKGQTDKIPAAPAQTGEYNAALTAIQADLDNPTQYKADVSGLATQASVNAIPTTPLLAANYTAPDNASIATIKAKTNLIPANPAVADEYDAALAAIQADLDNPNQYKADVSGLATQASVNAIPTTPLLAANYTAPDNATIGEIKAKTDNIPTTPLTAQQVWEYVTRELTSQGSGGATAQEVWEYATRVLTAGTNIDLTPLAKTTHLQEVEDKVDGIKGITDQLTFTVPNKVDASATVDPTGIATSEELDIIGEKVDGVLNKLNVSSVEFVTAVVGSNITILRGDTLAARLLDLGDLTQYASLDFTVKRVAGELDDAAKIRLRKNASGTDDGLLRINGAEYATATDGSIVIDDLTTGDIEIKLNAAATRELVPGNYVYDVQLIIANEVRTLTAGKLEVVADVTRAVA